MTKVIALVGEASFAPVLNMRAGFEPMFIDYVERPGLIQKLANIAIDYHIELYSKLFDEGVEIVILGDDYKETIKTLKSMKEEVNDKDYEGYFGFHSKDEEDDDEEDGM